MEFELRNILDEDGVSEFQDTHDSEIWNSLLYSFMFIILVSVFIMTFNIGNLPLMIGIYMVVAFISYVAVSVDTANELHPTLGAVGFGNKNSAILGTIGGAIFILIFILVDMAKSGSIPAFPQYTEVFFMIPISIPTFILFKNFIAPYFEEVALNGVVLPTLSKLNVFQTIPDLSDTVLANPVVWFHISNVIKAIIFVLWHTVIYGAEGGILLFLFVFSIGCGLGTYLTGSLAFAFVAHFILNWVA